MLGEPELPQMAACRDNVAEAEQPTQQHNNNRSNTTKIHIFVYGFTPSSTHKKRLEINS